MKELATLITRLHTNRITILELSEKSAYAAIHYCGEDKRCFAIEERMTGLQLRLHKSRSAFTEGHQAQRYRTLWTSSSPFVQAFNLNKNFMIQSLLKLKNYVVGIRLKKNPNQKPKEKPT